MKKILFLSLICIFLINYISSNENVTLECVNPYIFHDFSNCHSNDTRRNGGNNVICPNQGYAGDCEFFDGFKQGYDMGQYYVEKGHSEDSCELYGQTIEWEYHFKGSWRIGIYNVDIQRVDNKKYLKLLINGNPYSCPIDFISTNQSDYLYHFVVRLCYHCTPTKIEIFANGVKNCEHSHYKINKYPFVIKDYSSSDDNLFFVAVWNKYLTNENIQYLYSLGFNRTNETEVCVPTECPICDGNFTCPPHPECDPDCVHGDCVANNICNCTEGWTGPICNDTVCDPPCHHGTCNYDFECECYPGWEGNNCSDPICDPDCVHGDCVAPNKCVCYNNYFGPFCNETCFDPTCGLYHWYEEFVCSSNGKCLENETCWCAGGYYGDYCESFNQTEMCNKTELCDECPECPEPPEPPTCDPDCVHGNCVANNVCNCTEGWNGPICNDTVCETPCHHGYCNENHECVCFEGWLGEDCSDPFCNPQCFIHGDCVAPYKCVCDEGYFGPFCNRTCFNPDCYGEYWYEEDACSSNGKS
jgi:hypothetical protein